MVSIESTNTSNLKIAEKMLEIADLKSQTINVIGDGESRIKDVISSRRKYEHLNAKLDVIKAFKHNQNLKIFGDNNDDVLA